MMKTTLEDEIQFLLNIKYKVKGTWKKENDFVCNRKNHYSNYWERDI